MSSTILQQPDARVTNNAAEGDLLETIDCPFCGSSVSEPVTGLICDGPSHHLKEPYRSLSSFMSRCADCNTVYQRERLTKERLPGIYDHDNYHCYKSFSERGLIIRELAKLSARKLIRQIERCRPRNNDVFLDFGCGNGSWLELFRLCGVSWEMYGTEIGQGNVDHIRGLGFSGFVCDESNIGKFFEPATLGTIYMHHVIEHVPNPLEAFHNLKRILAPGGIIVGQTPDWRCLEQYLFRSHWAQWHLPHHLTVFDKRTMAAHAAKAGLEVVSLKSSPSAATQWSTSLLKFLAAKRGRVYRWTSEPLHAYLSLLFAPVSVLQTWFHNTSHLDFILRKPLR